MIKTFLGIWFCMIAPSLAQSTFDIEKAPLNPQPEKYTRSHFNLNGPVGMGRGI